MKKIRNLDKNKKNMSEPTLTDKLKKKIKNDNMKINQTRNKLNSGRVIPKIIVNMTDKDNKLLETPTKDIKKSYSNKFHPKIRFTKVERK